MHEMLGVEIVAKNQKTTDKCEEKMMMITTHGVSAFIYVLTVK